MNHHFFPIILQMGVWLMSSLGNLYGRIKRSGGDSFSYIVWNSHWENLHAIAAYYHIVTNSKCAFILVAEIWHSIELSATHAGSDCVMLACSLLFFPRCSLRSCSVLHKTSMVGKRTLHSTWQILNPPVVYNLLSLAGLRPVSRITVHTAWGHCGNFLRKHSVPCLSGIVFHQDFSRNSL